MLAIRAVGILLIATLIYTSCEFTGSIYADGGGIECGGDGEPIVLVDNPDATDPLFAELIAFIRNDKTDRKAYIESGPDGYVCADFAEDIHNNAEAAGIRASWVGITFENDDEGHALNAFETTDRGLVFIDCTSGNDEKTPLGEIQDWDTIAYVAIGKKYGVIHLNQAKSLQYSFYLEYEQKQLDYEDMIDNYHREVDEFNRGISGKVYNIGSPEIQIIETWEEKLKKQEQVINEMEKKLGYFYYFGLPEKDYIVEDFQIHW